MTMHRHTKTSCCRFSLDWLAHCGVAVATLLSAGQWTPASAQTDAALVDTNRPITPVYLWGVQRGCDPDPAAEQAIQRRLQALAGSALRRVERIELPAEAEHLNCVGEQCAELLRQQCPSAATEGQLLGGEIDDVAITESGGQALASRIRLWRHDLASKRTFYQARLCSRGYCGDRSVADAVAQMAGQILERPAFDADPRPAAEVRSARLPMCGEGSSAPAGNAPVGVAERVRAVDRLYQNIYVALTIDPAIGAEQKAITDLFTRALLTPRPEGYRDAAPHVEVRSPERGALDPAWTQRVLQAAISARPSTDRRLPPRLLVVQVGRRDELLTLDFRWLPATEAEAQEYDFPAAGYSPEPALTLGFMNVNALSATLRNERVAQMNRVRTAVERRTSSGPVDLCRPLPAPRCVSPQTAWTRSLGTTYGGSSPSQPVPLLAASKGALWGLFAASSATLVVLTALDQAQVGSVSIDDYTTVRGGLRSGMAVSGGAAALSLGLAIPITVLAAKKPQPQAGASAGTSPTVRTCRLLRVMPHRND